MTSSNAMRTKAQMIGGRIMSSPTDPPLPVIAPVALICNTFVLIGLELNRLQFFKKDNRVYRENLAPCCSTKGRSRARWDVNHTLTPRQAEWMNHESSKANSLGSWTPSMPSMARVSYEIEGGRRDTLRPKGRLRRDYEEPII